MTRVLIVDDFAAVRAGLRQLIEATDDLSVAGEASCGNEAVSMARDLKPDVILMDLMMSGCDGIEATRRIIADDPTASVLVLTAHTSRDRTLKAIGAGAIGYLLKDVEPSFLVDAVRAAGRGESPVDPRAARALIRELSNSGLARALSARELEVVRLVAKGLANKQIARRLTISEKTVKNHLTKVFTVLGVSGRTAAAMWAAENGLIDA